MSGWVAGEDGGEVLIEELQQEITELKMRDSELEQLSHTEDHLHLIQVCVLCLYARWKCRTSQDTSVTS